MAITFAELVDEVRSRAPEEQQELLRILDHARIDTRRAAMAQHARESLEEGRMGNLQFISDSSQLLRKLKDA